MQLTALGLVAALVGLMLARSAHADRPEAASGAAPSAVSAHARLLGSLYTDTDHVTVFTPIVSAGVASPAAGVAVEGQYLADIVSAASVDVVSTASPRWSEVRHAGTVEASYAPRPVTLRASAGLSTEPDYRSLMGGGSVSWDLADRSHTVLAGYAHTGDTIGRAGTSFDVFSRRLDTDTVRAGVTLTLNRSTLLSVMNELSLERGNQSKPYRYVPMFAPDVAPSLGRGASMGEVAGKRLPAAPLESLPRSRQRYALVVGLGRRFDWGTLRVEERGYSDSWGLTATTTEARYYADLSPRLRAWPRLRFHAQTPAYFHRRAYVAELRGGALAIPALRSGDRELGPLLTTSVGLGASFGLGPSARPEALSVTAQADAMHTEFLDALYVTSRNAGLATLGVDGSFD